MSSIELNRRDFIRLPIILSGGDGTFIPPQEKEYEPKPFNVTTLTFHDIKSSSQIEDELYPLLNEGMTPISVHTICQAFQGEIDLSRSDTSLLVTLDDGLKSQLKAIDAIREIEQGLGITIPLLFAVITKFAPRDDNTNPDIPSFDDKVHEYLTRGDILDILKSPQYDLANHTLNHARLSDLPDDEVRGELSISQRRINSLYAEAGRSDCPNVLVYPEGAYNQSVINTLKQYKIPLAFSTEPDSGYSLSTKYHLGRFGKT